MMSKNAERRDRRMDTFGSVFGFSPAWNKSINLLTRTRIVVNNEILKKRSKNAPTVRIIAFSDK